MPRPEPPPRRATALVCAALLALAVAAPSSAATPRGPAPPVVTPGPVVAPSVPSKGPLFADGPDGRLLLDGTWLFRRDDARVGTAQRWYAQRSTADWSPVTVPNAWNANDNSAASFSGTFAWYRKDFRLPDARAALRWAVRFQTVNYRAQVWLNGRSIGSHVGSYVAFDLPLTHLSRRGVNRLVVRVDNRRVSESLVLPDAFESGGQPAGGWWNYGGLLREVYLRRIDRLDVGPVAVRTSLRSQAGPASVDFLATVRNVTSVTQRARLTARFGRALVTLGPTRLIPAGGTATFTGRLTVRRPRLWWPGRPYLYRTRIVSAAADARARPGTRAARLTHAGGYTVLTGIRTIKVDGRGRLLVNGRVARLRGASLHEDQIGLGGATDVSYRRRTMALLRELGANVIRAHYPLHPQLLEMADRAGILVWSEIPAYQFDETRLGNAGLREAMKQMLTSEIDDLRNHPSIFTWSIANELSPAVGPNQAAYIREAAATARAEDPTRPVGLAVAGTTTVGCQPGYGPLDIIGLNDYFGWYTGPDGAIADRDLLGPWLDSQRRCYPRKAIIITEFGAEANRDGPVEERGTYQHQTGFIDYHVSAYDARPWLSGAIYWTLQEFKVRPDWDGGNPWASPPMHQKGVVSYAGAKKPGFYALQRLYRATPVLTPALRSRR